MEALDIICVPAVSCGLVDQDEWTTQEEEEEKKKSDYEEQKEENKKEDDECEWDESSDEEGRMQ